MTSEPKPQYRPDIDGLRALAVLAVVAFHAFPSLLPAGFVGVDVFFVISGYLISGILYKDLAAGRFTFLNFYARRARRILPALLTALAACWALGCVFLLAAEMKNLGKHIAGGALFVSNFVLWKEAGYFDANAATKPLLHLWSLAIEEQFYLTWPFLLAIVWRRRWSVPYLVGTLLISSFAFNLWRTTIHGREVFYLLPARLWELMLGCGLAYYERSASAPRLPATAASLAAAASLLCGLVLIRGADAYPGYWALAPTLSTVLFLHAGSDGWVNRRLLSGRFVVLVGRISYPLYLWHWIFFCYARIAASGTPSPSIRGALAALSMACAWLTWRFIELPIQGKLFARFASHAKERAFVWGGAACIAAAGVLGFFTWRSGGLPWRYPAMERVANDFNWEWPKPWDCLEKYGLSGDDYCELTAPDPEVILWGDSHANHLIQGLVDSGRHRPLSVIQLGKGDCPALDDVELLRDGLSYGCLAAYRRASSLIDREFSSARYAILSSYVSPDFNKDAAAGTDSLRVSSRIAERGLPQREVFKRGLSRTIDRLESQGKRVVLAIDVPDLGFDPMECFGARPFYPQDRLRSDCFVSRAEVDAQQREYRRVVAELQSIHPRMAVFDPVPYLCDARFCPAILDGKLMYRDGNHLSSYGSRYIGAHLVDAILGRHAPAARD